MAPAELKTPKHRTIKISSIVFFMGPSFFVDGELPDKRAILWESGCLRISLVYSNANGQ
jgi:hypothetical protein